MLKVFVGYDERQPISFTVLSHSILINSSEPVAITPIRLSQIKDFERQGLTPFTFSRFLVPYLCNYQGTALFLDIDMILNEDIAKLFNLAHPDFAVQVVKNDKKFEWASVMLFNCAHEENKKLTPEYVSKADGLHTINWCDEGLVGELPSEWNHLVGYDKPNKRAKLIHYTQGNPIFPETLMSEHADLWKQYLDGACSTIPWAHLMGNSVHAAHIRVDEQNAIPLPRFMFDELRGAPKPEYEPYVRKLLTSEEDYRSTAAGCLTSTATPARRETDNNIITEVSTSSSLIGID